MSLEEYHLMSREPGWKYEYVDGYLHKTPSHTIVTGRLALRFRAFEPPDGLSLRPAQPEMLDALLEAAFDAFHDTIEYCDWKTEKITKNLRDGLERLLMGGIKKPLLEASRTAFVGDRLIGAAFFVQSQPGPELVLFFVMRDWQRRGVGRALLESAVNTLLESGASELFVTWHAGNRASHGFYTSDGFEIVPDLFHAMHMRHVAHHNLDHGLHTGVGIEAARLELERWGNQVDALERIKDEQGFDAVTPWRDLGW